MPDDCIFCKIAAKSIPSEIIYENEELLAFRDIQPHAPVHILVIPKEHFPTIVDMEDGGLMGRCLAACVEVAKQTGVDEDGFRVVINTRDDGGQTVEHVHFHVMGGRFLSWPPG